MARIYPEHLPAGVEQNPGRQAECKVFERLTQLSDQFTVFYSVAWQLRSRYTGVQDGEADFVVAHPDLGVMFIEVKGGGIRYDANLDQWYSLARSGVVYEIKDPVQQARDSKGALLKKLEELPGWEPGWFTVGYIACFPDVTYDASACRPDLPREIVMDSADLEKADTIIRRAFAHYAGETGGGRGLGMERLQKLTHFLAHSFELSTPLGVELEYQDQQLVRLTEQQMGILNFLKRHRRALVEGCAGSGKTMLALEKARRLSEQGFEVLLTCFNFPLAEYLSKRVPDGVTVQSFHGLCRTLASAAGLKYRAYKDDQDLFDNVLPAMLLEALSTLDDSYHFDAVIVDEGQDFLPHWLENLMFLLRDTEQGVFYVFRDNNQNIYRRAEGLASIVAAPPYALDTNCRNTQRIHAVVNQFYRGEAPLDCIGPQGISPEVHCYRDANDQIRILRSKLHKIIKEEKIAAREVVLLTPNNPQKTDLQPGLQLGNFHLVERVENLETDILVSSIHRFKGLDSKVVIIANIHAFQADWLDQVFYVGASRARTYLTLLVDQGALSSLPAELQKHVMPC